MNIEELIERHKLRPDTPPPSEKCRMAKADARQPTSNWKRDPFENNLPAPPPGPATRLLRAKHYQPRDRNQRFRQQTPPAKAPWLQPEDTSDIDKPLNSGQPTSTKFTDQVRAVVGELLAHGVALGGDSQRDGERWLSEYLDAHHELQADFLCEIYARAIRAIVQEGEA